MTDSCTGYNLKLLIACLDKYGPDLSAMEIAHLEHVSVRQVMCVIRNAPNAWWLVEAVPAERGFRYRKRHLLSRDVKIVEREIRQYCDAGITKTMPREVSV